MSRRLVGGVVDAVLLELGAGLLAHSLSGRRIQAATRATSTAAPKPQRRIDDEVFPALLLAMNVLAPAVGGRRFLRSRRVSDPAGYAAIVPSMNAEQGAHIHAALAPIIGGSVY